MARINRSIRGFQNAYVIIWSIRLPTAIMALLVGASLGIAGAGMQTILDNPLSSPYTLGISAGLASVLLLW